MSKNCQLPGGDSYVLGINTFAKVPKRIPYGTQFNTVESCSFIMTGYVPRFAHYFRLNSVEETFKVDQEVVQVIRGKLAVRQRVSDDQVAFFEI